MARLNVSTSAFVSLDEEFAKEAMAKLVEVDKDWVPHAEGNFALHPPVYFWD